MFTVIKLGGCNGSGKTSVARALIEMSKATMRVQAKNGAYYQGEINGIKVIVLGSYEKVCGGMDTISDKEDRLALLKKHCRGDAIVFYEGLITGKTYGAMGAMSEEHVKKGKGRWLYAFMDTPLEVCVARTEQRRAAAAAAKGTTPSVLDPERTLRPTFQSCQHLAEKLRGTRKAKVGPQPYPHPVLMLNHKHKPAKLAEALFAAAEKLHAQ